MRPVFQVLSHCLSNPAGGIIRGGLFVACEIGGPAETFPKAVLVAEGCGYLTCWDCEWPAPEIYSWRICGCCWWYWVAIG